MNPRFVVLGVVLIGVGGLLFVYPGTLASSGTVYDHNYLVRVAPGNYSYIQVAVTSQQSLRVTFSSSPDSVDFFLMNSSSFSNWSSRGTQPVDVYSQSKLDASNDTFTVAGVEGSINYSLVFFSRTASTPTNLLLRLVVEQEPSMFDVFGVPALFIVVGIALAGFGVSRKKKEKRS